jgi:plastocyanin
MEKHKVEIDVTGRKKFTYTDPCLLVRPGDRIEWTLKKKFPYGIVIKFPVSPLNWCFKMAGKGKKITATVSAEALPGVYSYGVGVFDGASLLFDDPDIIVRRP